MAEAVPRAGRRTVGHRHLASHGRHSRGREELEGGAPRCGEKQLVGGEKQLVGGRSSSSGGETPRRGEKHPIGGEPHVCAASCGQLTVHASCSEKLSFQLSRPPNGSRGNAAFDVALPLGDGPGNGDVGFLFAQDFLLSHTVFSPDTLAGGGGAARRGRTPL